MRTHTINKLANQALAQAPLFVEDCHYFIYEKATITIPCTAKLISTLQKQAIYINKDWSVLEDTFVDATGDVVTATISFGEQEVTFEFVKNERPFPKVIENF